MARVTELVSSTKSASLARKPGRPPKVIIGAPERAQMPGAAKRLATVGRPEKRKPGRPAKMAGAVFKKAPTPSKATARFPVAAAAPKVSKDELRAQVGRLEQLVASLRSKSRETNKAAKTATARISELEAQVAQLEKRAAAPRVQPSPAHPARAKRQGREIDPGDAVPPGVAVQEPEPLDEEAEGALENLEHHLGKR